MADYLRESGVKWLWEKIKTLLSAKQDKLVSGSNIKTINGTSVLGSGNITIEGGNSTGDVDEGRLVWSDNYASRGTLLDNIMKIGGNNVLAFMPPSAITIEYSTDNGVTWLDYGWNDNYKTILVTPEFGFDGLFLGKNSNSLSSNNRLRITFDFIAANMRFTPSKACIYYSGVNNSDYFYTKLSIEKYNNYKKDVWEEFANQKITTGDWGTFRLPTEDWGYKGSTYRARFRCEFYRTADSIHSTAIANIIITATKIVTANSYAKNHHLYTFDFQQNATFPNAIKGKKLITDGGKSTQVVKGDGSLEEESALAVATAIDAEHAQEADYAGVADKAEKLATPRKIGLTGGAVGTATNFDGSGNINIPVTKIDEGILAWSENYAQRGTLLDNIMKISGNNVLAFMPPSAITIEYSTDNGVTWLDYSWNDNYKTTFVTPEFGFNGLFLGKSSSSLSSNNRLRITYDFIAANMRFTPSKSGIYFFGVNNSDSFHTKLLIEKYNNYGKDVWEELSNQKITSSGWGTFRLPTEDWGHKDGTYRARFRCEFYRTADSVNSTAIANMIIMATDIVTANPYAKNHRLYTFDLQQNATFPAAVTATKHVTQGGTSNQVVLGNGGLKPISELSPITDADAEILLDNHIHSIDVNANGNDVNISVIESSKSGNTWETEDNDIPIPLATPTSAGVMSKEDKAKLDGNISIEPDSGMPDFIGDFEYSDVDYEAIIDLTTVDWINWVEGGLFVMNAEETWEENNGDTSYHQCVVTFIYRSNGCIPISIVNTNKMTAKMSGMVITINLTEGTGEIRFKQIKLI